MQLSSLPVLLSDDGCSMFDVKLVQFQKAIRLCASVLACICPGKDYTSILTISMLIARIIAFVECGSARPGSDKYNNAPSVDMTDSMSPIRSPKFSVGSYEIDGDEENSMTREVWWLQIGKVESLVAGFKEMVAKMIQQQVHEDNAQDTPWVKLGSLLDQKAQAVRKDLSAHRG